MEKGVHAGPVWISHPLVKASWFLSLAAAAGWVMCAGPARADSSSLFYPGFQAEVFMLHPELAHPEPADLKAFALAAARLDRADVEQRVAANRELLGLLRREPPALRFATEQCQAAYAVLAEHQQAVARFARCARGDESLEVVRWLITEGRSQADCQAAAEALARVETPAANALLGEILAGPHPCATVTVMAIQEAARRKLSALAPRVGELRAHYRKDVREAARKAAAALHCGPAPAFDVAGSLTPALRARLDAIRRLAPEVPKTAAWCEVRWTADHLGPNDEVQGDGQIRAWLVAEDAQSVRLVTAYGGELRLPKKAVTLVRHSFAEDAEKSIPTLSSDLRWEQITGDGGLWLSEYYRVAAIPPILVAAWELERGDERRAAALLLPKLDLIRDERNLSALMEVCLGQMLECEMLKQMTRRDFGRAAEEARKLSQPSFAHSPAQAVAIELAGQLARRREDFTAWRLPTPEAWAAQRGALSRPEQIQYLMARLRLMTCTTDGKSGEAQYAEPPAQDGADPRTSVINPWQELRALHLTPGDFPALVPGLEDRDFLTGSCIIDGSRPPGPFVPRVNWVIATLLDDAAKFEVSELPRFVTLDEAGRRAHVAQLAEWGRAHAGYSPDELMIQALVRAKTREDFFSAVYAARERKLPGTASILLERMADFPGTRVELASYIYESKARVALEAAGDWIQEAKGDEAMMMRYWGGLALVRDGDARQRAQGVAALRQALADPSLCANGYYRQAFPVLIRHPEDAGCFELACGILKWPNFFDDGDQNDQMLKSLLETGREEVLQTLYALLNSAADAQQFKGTWKGQPVHRTFCARDRIAGCFNRIRSDGWVYDPAAPDAVRSRAREELKVWLKDQFVRIRAEQPNAFAK